LACSRASSRIVNTACTPQSYELACCGACSCAAS
jgi:hypothetical protein